MSSESGRRPAPEVSAATRLCPIPPTRLTYRTRSRCSSRVQQRLPFSSMFMSAAPVITATATAGSVTAGGNPCMLALNTTRYRYQQQRQHNRHCADLHFLFRTPRRRTRRRRAAAQPSLPRRSPALAASSIRTTGTSSSICLTRPPLPDPFANVTPDPSDMHCAVSSTRSTAYDLTPLDLTDGMDITTMKDGAAIRQLLHVAVGRIEPDASASRATYTDRSTSMAAAST